MISLLQEFTRNVYHLLEWVRGFEETGNIAIDCVLFKTRDQLKEMGML